MIVVSSYKGSPFLHDCLDSIPSDIPCVVWRGGGYECGGLRFVQKLDVEEVFFMQDSARILDPFWLYEILADKGTSYSVNNETGLMSMYTGKIKVPLLRQITIPETPTKMDAVLFEMTYGHEYAKLDPETKVLWPDLRLDNARREEINGRPYMVYENIHFRKFKGCFGGWMISDVCALDQATRAAHP